MLCKTRFTLACEPILAQGGTVYQFVRDELMAVFGAPARFSDHVKRAILADLLIKQTAKDFQKWVKDCFPDRDLPAFKIGIGLHTGDVVIGNIASPKRTEFHATGDTVNVASRLEGATQRNSMGYCRKR